MDKSSSSDEMDLFTYRLMVAVRCKKPIREKLKMIEALLKQGADIDFRDANDNLNTALHLAVRRRDLKVAAFLVRNHANINVQNAHGTSALEYAERTRNKDLIDILNGKTECLDDEAAPESKNVGVLRPRRELDEEEIRSRTLMRPKFKRLADDSGASGHRFEINLLTLFKLRGENRTKDFYLAGNLEDAGAFDDVVFKYWDLNNQNHPKVIFLQAKHRQDPTQREISWDTFKTEKDFALEKYFRSYLDIKRRFAASRKDPIFKGTFEGLDCQFAILTNVCLDVTRLKGLLLGPGEQGPSFEIGIGGNEVQIDPDYGVRFLMDSERKDHVELSAKRFVEFVSAERPQTDETVKEYHVFWARTVLDIDPVLVSERDKKGHSKTHRKAKLRWDFLLNPATNSKDPSLELFTREILRLVKKRKLEDEVFRVPEEFGNISERTSLSSESLCNRFADVVQGSKMSGRTCVITEMPKKLLADLGKLVGKELVQNEDTGLLRLRDDNLGAPLGKMDFDFQVKGFPRLSLRRCSPGIKEEDARDFLKHLRIFTDQPSAIALDSTIKQELKGFYQLTDEEVHQSFLRINYKMTKWWLLTGPVDFLRKGDGLFSDIVRNGIHYRLRKPTPSFTGRIKELDQLHGSLQGGSQMVAVSGLGGIGKSELARKYACDYSSHYDNNIVWIDADNLGSLRASFVSLCRNALNIPTEDEDGAERDLDSIVADVYGFFSKRRSLFVFDNAQSYKDSDEGTGIKRFLPSGPNILRPCVIVTSRNRTWPAGSTLPLGTFTDQEARDFVRSFLGISSEDSQEQDIRSLTEMLQNFPLALQQGVAFIRERNEDLKMFSSRPNRGFGIRDYLRLYEEKSKDLLNFNFPEDSLDLYTTTTFKTWNITMETIQELKYGRDAISVTTVMAYMDPNNIPREFFCPLLENNEKKLRRSLRLLSQYCLVTADDDDGTVSIHRLVQQVIRINLKDQKLENPTLRVAMALIARHDSSKHVSRGVTVWNYAKGHSDIVCEFHRAPCSIIDALVEDIRYRDALTFAAPAFETLTVTLGEDHKSTMDTQFRVPQIMHRQGRYGEALGLYQEVFEKERKVLGEDHASTLNSQHSIAQVLSDDGKYEEGLEIYGEVLRKQSRALGEEHGDTVSTLHNMGQVHFSQGAYDKALAIYEDVADKYERTLGPEHRDTLFAKHHVAQVWYKKGDYGKALSSFEEDLEKQMRVSGPNGLPTLGIKSNIAHLLANQGKYDRALRTYEEVLEKQSEIFGPEHPDPLKTQNNICQVLYKLFKYDKALALYEEVLEKQIQVLGPDHPDTLTTKHNMAQTLRNQEKYDKALVLYEEVLAKRTQRWGPDHPNTLTTLHNMAQLFADQGKYEKAWASCDQILAKRLRILGPNHPDTLNTRYNMAQILSEQGKLDEALRSFREILVKQVKILGPDHPTTIGTHYNVANVLRKQGKSKEALATFQEVLEEETRAMGPDHQSTVSTQYRIAELQCAEGQHVEALSSFREIYEKSCRTFGPNHTAAIVAQRNVAGALMLLGRTDEGLGAFKRAYERQLEILGPDHKDTVEMRIEIGASLLAIGRFQEAFDWHRTTS